MARRLFISVRELDHVAVVVGPSQERDSSGQIISGKSGGDDDRRNVNQKSIDVRRALLIDKRRVDSVLDQCRLVFHRFMHDGIEPIVGHHLQKKSHQFGARFEILIMRVVAR